MTTGELRLILAMAKAIQRLAMRYRYDDEVDEIDEAILAVAPDPDAP